MKFEGLKTDGGETLEGTDSFELKRPKSFDEQVLAGFTEAQQKIIKDRQRQLSALAYFIGKDFEIPVELNKPGEGWHWDFQNNIIRIDPKDLLEKPMDYLRFVISHEGGHRRISRTDFIPVDVWRQKGFSFLMNAIEDPRDNNFVAANYPNFAKQMKLAYEADLTQNEQAKTKAKEGLGYQPRFMQAGFEFIKQWYKWHKKEPYAVSADLPEEVRQAVEKTLPSGEDAWRRYPTKKEADESEESIGKYAKVSYEIILEEIWPEFQKLVEQDLQDQKMAEFMKDLEKKKQESTAPNPSSSPEGKGTEEAEGEEGKTGESQPGQTLPQELSDKLTPEEKEELEKGMGKAVDLDSLSPELKKKIKDFMDSLPEEKQKELVERAEKALKDFERELDKEMGGKLTENPEQRGVREKKEEEEEKEREKTGKESKLAVEKDGDKKAGESKTEGELKEKERTAKEIQKIKEQFEKIASQDATVYDGVYEKVSGIINGLTNDLRNVFRDRKKEKMQTGKKSGSRINIGRRITELAEKILPIESRAWERRSAPEEKDYAISLLVDLSGSMRGEKIRETFKAVVVLAEVLNKIGIKCEILGFNDHIQEYLVFGAKMSSDIRRKMPVMLTEVSSASAAYNDDGWALTQSADRLAKQTEKIKILISLSDGIPEPSSKHADWDLGESVANISKQSKIKLIGLGIGQGTGHVASYYPKAIANVSVEEMAERLAAVVKEAIVNY